MMAKMLMPKNVGTESKMVSRRRILSRSRDDLTMDMGAAPFPQEEEEDVWYNKDKLYKDHIQEVLDKWSQIDDEIWAKVIVLERNRRVAKAYARAPVLTVNGSDDGFDGFRIGLCGFDNPMRDSKTDELKKHIGHGVKLKMDDQGNILVKRVAKCNVYVKPTTSNSNEETSIGPEVLKLRDCALEMDKPVKLFDMKKFQANVSRELRRAYPDRRRLECQCLSAIAFVKQESDVIECPIWVLIINVVAMDMLKSKLPPVKRPVDIRNRPRIPVPDEDPYSVAAGSSSGGSSGGGGPAPPRRADKPPKLPPRGENPYPHHIPKSVWLQPDYDDIDDDTENQTMKPAKNFPSSRGKDKKDSHKHDDPYYCGLRARVPNFAKLGGGGKSKEKHVPVGGRYVLPPGSHLALHQMHQHQAPPPPPPHIWHARSYDSGMELLESPYNHIYGRLPIPTRGYIPPTPRTMYISEWD